MYTKYLSTLGFILLTVSAACAAPATRPPAVRADSKLECSGGIIRSTQDAAAYTACTSVTGNLGIQGVGFTGLSPLKNLRRVSGSLVIANNPRLESLWGLNNLMSVGSLTIRQNPALESLTQLEGLSRATVVTISHNPSLRRLEGLRRLTVVDALLLQNNGITDTTGLEGLRTVGSLVVAENRRLISLGGLNNLTRARSVAIRKNPRLCAALGFLPKLAEVEQPMLVGQNAGLSRGDVEALLKRVRIGRPFQTTAGRTVLLE